MEAVKKRNEISSEYKWNLTDIYPSRESWDADFQKLKSMLPELRAFDGKLDSVQNIATCFRLTDSVAQFTEKLYVYSHLKHHEDTSDAANQGPVSIIEQLSVEVSEAASFIEPELLSLPVETLAKFAEHPDLRFYRFTLDNIIRQKPHTLPKEQQALLAKAGIMAEAPNTIFSMLSDADMKFPIIKDEKDNDIELTHGRYYKFMESRDRRVRKDAFEAMFGTFGRQKNTIASILNAQVQKNIFYARALHYDSVLSMALFGDNIPVSVYTNLISAVEKNLGAFQKYLTIRKRVLALDELHMYDLSVPLIKNFEWKVTYSEAIAIINEAIAPLGGEYSAILKDAWKKYWIDVYENEGKHSGAYSWGVYKIHPYVLLNYQDTVHDMFTIAHEMGHALHSYLAHREQEYRYAHYTIFTAEIASTLNEALLLQYLLKTTTDREKRAYLLTHYADNFRGTLFVQTLFAEFEKIVHEQAEQGIPLTVSKFNEIFFDLHKKYYGSVVVLDPAVEMGWMRIPHFYSSFYVYKYATGFSAANSFCHRILHGGPAEVDAYLGLLKSGGKDYSLNLLKTAGVDMSTTTPIFEALKVFASTVEELDKIL
ncbi:MAG: oligoendopeptidase F [Bacteroidota bacterium]